MRRRLPFSLPGAIALAILLATSLATSAFAGVIQQLDFTQDDVLPSAQPDIVFHNNTGSAETALYSVSAGQLHQRTIDVDGNASYLSPNASLTGGPFDATRTVSMVARVRVVSIGSGANQVAGGAYFQVCDGANSLTVAFQPGGLQVPHLSGTPEFVPLDITSFHTYQLVSPGNSPEVRLFVDGVLSFSGIAPASALNGFDFGDGMSEHGAEADAYWDFIRVAQEDPITPTPNEGWRQIPPIGRTGARAIYDPIRDRLLFFGGNDETSSRGGVWSLNLLSGSRLEELHPLGAPPSPRTANSAIYDPLRDRLIVMGGTDALGIRNDVWTLSLSGTPTWEQIATTGPEPLVRTGHVAVYDEQNLRMIVFAGVGGASGSTQLSDVWALSLSETPTWSEITPTGGGPSPRSFIGAIYDPVGKRMIVSGGAYANATWSLNLDGAPSWSQITPAGLGPSYRVGQTAVYDAASRKMIVFGGLDDNSVYNETWVLSLAGAPAWSQMMASSPPLARHDHAAIYDPIRHRTLVYGGNNRYLYGRELALSDVWALDLAGSSTWAQIYPATSVPSGRYDHSSVYDPIRQRMITFGGYDGTFKNDVWSLSLGSEATWSPVATAGIAPAPRAAHTAIYDPINDRMIVYGGTGSSGFFGDVWALTLAGTPTWTQLPTLGTTPTARYNHTAVYDAVRQRMLIYGGGLGPSYTPGADVWALSLAGTPTWSQLPVGGTAPARLGHCAVYDLARDRMVVFGGSTPDPSNETWTLSLGSTPTWSLLTIAGTPPTPSGGHDGIFDPRADRLIVFGGDEGRDAWTLDLGNDPMWAKLAPVGPAPGGRSNLTTIFDPVSYRMILFGGSGYGDLWELALGDPCDAGPQSPPPFRFAWGTPGTGPDQFNDPTGVAVDAASHIFVTDYNNNRVQQFDAHGTFVTSWGTAGPGDGQFDAPNAVAVDAAGHVFVVDYNNSRIQKFTNDGVFLTSWGAPSGTGDGQLDHPACVAIDAASNVYVTDWGNNRIQKFTNDGAFLLKWGTPGSGNGEFNQPYGVAVDAAGYVYVVDQQNYRVQKFTGDGVFLTAWGSGAGQFNNAYGIAVDAQNHVFVADRENNRIQEFNCSGSFLAQWGSLGSGAGEMRAPHSIAIDTQGRVYVADTQNHRIARFGGSPIRIPVVLTPTSNDLWISPETFFTPIVSWIPADPEVAHLRLAYSVDGVTWMALATGNVLPYPAQWSMTLPLARAETATARVRLEAYDASANFLGSSLSDPFAIGDAGAIRLDVQRNNESQFSPPILFWTPDARAASYSIYVAADQATSCGYDNWVALVPATRTWVPFDSERWRTFPATRCNVTVTAMSASGSPILPRQTYSFVRFKLTDLDPNNTSNDPVVLVHGWVSSLYTWYTCGDTPPGRSALVDGLRTGPGQVFHPWAFEYPNIQAIVHSAAGLAKAVEYVRGQNDGKAVRLVAHSMGGLVSRAYLEGLVVDPGTNADAPRPLAPAPEGAVSHLVTLSTPHLGEPPEAVDAAALWHSEDFCVSFQGVQVCHIHDCAGCKQGHSTQDLKDNSTFIQRLNGASLPPIKYLLTGGTVGVGDGPTGSAQGEFLEDGSKCEIGADAVVDICSALGDVCGGKHPTHLPDLSQAVVVRAPYALSHKRMSRPGNIYTDYPENNTYCSSHNDKHRYGKEGFYESESQYLLNDVLGFLRCDKTCLQSAACPIPKHREWRTRIKARSGGGALALARGRGHVSTSSDTPVAGAFVQFAFLGEADTLAGLWGYSDRNGEIVADLPKGNFVVRTLAQGYVARTDTITVDPDFADGTQVVSLELDPGYEGPLNPWIVLDDHAPTTVNPALSVQAGCDGTVELQLSEDATFSGSTWQPLAPTLPFTLTAEPGGHAVFARFRDASGHESSVVSEAIRLDSLAGAPLQITSAPVAGSIVVDGLRQDLSTPATLTPGSGYHTISMRLPGWRFDPPVASVDGDVAGSLAFTATPSTPPTAPAWVSPPRRGYAGATTRARWTASASPDPGEAIFYDVSVYDDSSAASPRYSTLGLQDTSAVIPNLCDSCLVWTSVEAVNGHEARQTAAATRLSVYFDRTPPRGQVLYPAAGSVVPGAAPPALRFGVSDWSGPTTACVTLSTDGGASFPDTVYCGAYADSIPWISPAVRSSRCRIRLLVSDRAGNTSAIESDSLFALYGDLTANDGPHISVSLSLRVRPLPARGNTKVTFDLPKASSVRLEAFDVAGRSVRLLAVGRYAAGSYALPWDLSGGDGVRLTSGVYFMRLLTDDGSRLSRLVVIQ